MFSRSLQRPGISRKFYELFLGMRLGKIDDRKYEDRFSLVWDAVESDAQNLMDSDADLSDFKALVLQLGISIKPTLNDVSYALRLFRETRDLASKLDRPITVFETGTAKGFSSLTMSLAMDKKHGGAVHTIDILPHSKELYWNAYGDKTHGKRSRLGLVSKWPELAARVEFHEGETETVIRNLDLPQIDLAFLDAQHDYQSVMSEFRYVSARQVASSVIVLDDVDESKFPGIFRAVKEIESGPHPYNVELVEPSGIRKAIAILRRV